MNLKAKTSVIIAITIGLFLFFLVTGVRSSMLEQAKEADRLLVEQNAERVFQYFNNEWNLLSRLTLEWAIRDDTYHFITDENTQYADAILSNETLKNIQVDFMIFLKPNFDFFYQKGFSVSGGKEIFLPNDFYRDIVKHFDQKNRIDDTDMMTTVFGPALISVQTVYPSNHRGSRGGYIIMGKMIDDYFIEQMNESLGVNLRYALALHPAQTKGQVDIEVIDEQKIETTVFTYPLTSNVYNSFSFTSDRSIFQDKKKIFNLYAIYIVIFTLLMAVILIISLDSMIVSRIKKLADSLKTIREKKDITTRVQVDVKKTDEITNLQISLNQMLQALEDSQKDLIYQSQHHDITQLPNREALQDYFKIISNKHHGISCLNINLDGFKRINDSQGALFGNDLLKMVGRRMQGFSREHGGSIFHLGGDEFMMIIHSTDQSWLQEQAEQLLENIRTPFALHGRKIYLTGSIGIASLPAGNTNFIKFIQDAGIAIGEAKGKGKNRFVFFEDIKNKSLYLHILDMENDLRRAIEKSEFILHFQPIFNNRADKIEIVEVLLRWDSPTKGIVPPGEFIPVAEALNLMPEIGLWVLEESMKTVKQWNDGRAENIGVSVNVSKSQIRDSTLVQRIEQLMKENEFPPSLLHIELTESDVNDEIAQVITFSNSLRKLGVKVALDDFGVGTSSLTYLREMPIDIVKIDRDFIKKIPEDEFSAALLSGMYDIFENLGYDIVTEGVENHEQLQFIQANSKSKIQGFLLGRPVPAKEMEVKCGKMNL